MKVLVTLLFIIVFDLIFQYDARFGDVFWNSSIENMLQHIFRLMTSWAVVADIWYLPPVKRLVRFSFVHNWL